MDGHPALKRTKFDRQRCTRPEKINFSGKQLCLNGSGGEEEGLVNNAILFSVTADRHVAKDDNSLEDIYVFFCLSEREITGLKQFSPLVGA